MTARQQLAVRQVYNCARMQCVACERWMRLRGKRLEVVGGKITQVAVQRFYGGCTATGGGDHPFDGDVCHVCCPTKCLEMLAEMSTSTETPGVARDEAFDKWIMLARKARGLPTDLGGSLAESAD